MSAFSGWLAFRGIIRKGPALDTSDSKAPLVEFLGIIILTIMMFVGLMYRWTFSITMLLATELQKIIFHRNASSRLIRTGYILSIFPILPVVGPEPRIYLV